MELKEMFPAKNSSPATALAVNITASTTSITVSDASVFPAAPNLAVIGTGIAAETIRYNAITDNVLSGVTRGINGTTAAAWPQSTPIGRNFTSYDQDAIQENIETLNHGVSEVIEDMEDVNTRMVQVESDIDDLEAALTFKRYGVSGIGQSANALTRLWDAVGMTAQVGTDGDNSNVVNDFDSATPWNWRKCVGTWDLDDNGDAEFHVAAYLGDDNYTEDGSLGDYVAVEVPISFFTFDGSTLGISAHKYPGYRAFDIFCVDHDQNRLMSKIYLPAYALALNGDNEPVVLPGLDNEQGSYHSLLGTCRAYKNGALGTLAILEPNALHWYLYAMMTVEFADQNSDNWAKGCQSLRHENADTCTFTDETHVLVASYNAGRVVGQCIAITPDNIDRNDQNYKATHIVLSVTRCDSTGTASESGTYTLLEVQDLGKNYWEYNTATTYRIVARPWRTGSCNSVGTPSGSPISNSDGYHPFRYRYFENPFGNQYSTTMDFFSRRLGSNDSTYYLKHYLLLDPGSYTPSSTSKPDATELSSDKFAELGIQTEHDNYVNGYIKSKKYDTEYPDQWIPYLTSGGSGTTYFCDYASLVNSYSVRSRRARGNWYTGAIDGPSSFYANYAPSYGYANFGGCLCVAQKKG